MHLGLSVECDGPQGPGLAYIMSCSSSDQLLSFRRFVCHAEETMVAKRQSGQRVFELSPSKDIDVQYFRKLVSPLTLVDEFSNPSAKTH
jgi:hypothetical protein